jgi:hypothetical protein
MPPHEVYIEPFLGGGAVMRLKRPARLNIGIDRDEQVIASWLAGEGDRLTPEMAAAAVGAQNGVSAGRVAAAGAARRQQPPELAPLATGAASGGSEFQFLVGDGIEFLRAYPFTGRELVYCDPPYLLSTRASGSRYRYELSDRDHQELLAVIQRLPCHVMISGYSSAMYAKALRKWSVYSFQAATRGKPAAEWVWCNFPRPVELHDYRFLGDNKRERERIRRRQRRWTARLRLMEPIERQALLAAIAEVAGSGVPTRPAATAGAAPRAAGPRAPAAASSAPSRSSGR